MSDSKRIAVVLFNLGGPDKLEAVEPFLFNIFSDPFIIPAVKPVRKIIAWIVSKKRGPKSREIFSRIGGCSPLLENTRAQATALEEKLKKHIDAKTFVCMRYWHPFCHDVIRELMSYLPERVILLPLYPQWSKVTTGSAIANWEESCEKVGFSVETCVIDSFYDEEGFIESITELTMKELNGVSSDEYPRILFSAHGIPKRIIDSGDVYQTHCEKTANAIINQLGINDIEWVVCYQSKIGVTEWIGPSTKSEIVRAGRDRKSVLIIPISFVSEHSETLVELDIEYLDLAMRCGVIKYTRVATVGISSPFISGLERLVVKLCI